MSVLTTETTALTPDDDNAYNAGYFDGELDALTKVPAALATDRASMAEQYDPLWAQGYSDGYLAQIEYTYALAEKTRAVS